MCNTFQFSSPSPEYLAFKLITYIRFDKVNDVKKGKKHQVNSIFIFLTNGQSSFIARWAILQSWFALAKCKFTWICREKSERKKSSILEEMTHDASHVLHKSMNLLKISATILQARHKSTTTCVNKNQISYHWERIVCVLTPPNTCANQWPRIPTPTPTNTAIHRQFEFSPCDFMLMWKNVGCAFSVCMFVCECVCDSKSTVFNVCVWYDDSVRLNSNPILHEWTSEVAKWVRDEKKKKKKNRNPWDMYKCKTRDIFLLAWL